MKPTIKIFSLLGFVMDVSRTWTLESESEYVQHRAKHLLKAARDAANFYPATDLKGSQLKHIQKAIIQLKRFEISVGTDKGMPAILAVVLCGVDDILSHTKNPLTKKLFEKINQMALWLNALADPKLDRTADYIRGDWVYADWTGGPVVAEKWKSVMEAT